jgi:uncharacterized protein
MSNFSRRQFLTVAGTTATTAILASPLQKLYANSLKANFSKGFGPLQKDPKGIFDLPKGFQYRAFSKMGDTMTDGSIVPTYHDGMAAFAGANGTTVLIRNHELTPQHPNQVIAPETKMYDKLAKGGTTTLIIDQNRQLVKHYVSLAGTSRNCAGGATPWNSWISCEEDTSTPQLNPVSKKHGYNFEVKASDGLIAPVPLIAMGRFNHEAIAVDPKTGYVYQTEDKTDSCIYRFKPKEYGNLKAGGVLEALVIKGKPKLDTSLNFPLKKPLSVEWVKIDNIDPDTDTLRYEAQDKGAAIFKRGEGAIWAENQFYFTCTTGGNKGIGQIFRYHPVSNTLELFVESDSRSVLEHPDNLTISPFGHLIVCEDGGGEQFLVGVNQKGECYHFGKNALNGSELAGVCFAPDGKTMFVNIFNPGITLAIWGDWSF